MSTKNSKTKVDIILPVYYEQDNIEKVIQGIEKYTTSPHRIFAIWQDKKDPSIFILKKLQKKYTSLEVIECKSGVGMRQALTTGFKHTSADIIIIMMSDLSDNPKQIEQMLKKISEGYDFVCATRYSKGGKRIGGSKIKAFMSWFACVTLRMITGIPTSDATNAYKCFKRSLLKRITVESTAGFEIPLELVVKAYRLGYMITEIPTVWREREKGSSSFKVFSWIPFYMRWYTAAIKYRYFTAYEK